MKRTESRLEEEASNTLAGFRKNRGTLDHNFTLRMIVQKYREVTASLNTCIIDYSKDFYSVNHEGLWTTLKEMNFDPKTAHLIRSLYEGQQAATQLGSGTTDWFPITKGVRQGCTVSPHLFSIYDVPTLQGLPIRDLRYADDTALLATTPKGLVTLI